MSTNLGGPLRTFPHLWAGMLRASEKGSALHRSYCDTAIARLGAVTAERAAEPAGPLFAARAGA